MKVIFALSFFFVVCSPAYAAVLSEQSSRLDVFPLSDPSASETYYGALSDSPHTYQFLVQEEIPFTAVLSTASEDAFDDTLSLILVKEEKRGVSEVGRVTGKDVQWHSFYDHPIALPMRESQPLDVMLEKGMYRLEVSSPDNAQSYKLDINNGSPASYKELFIARKVFGLSYFSVVFAIRVYIPLLIFLGFLYYRKYKKRNVS